MVSTAKVNHRSTRKRKEKTQDIINLHCGKVEIASVARKW